MTEPSLFGVIPMSDSKSAFSTSPSADLSYTSITSCEAVGAVTLASWLSGVGAP